MGEDPRIESARYRAAQEARADGGEAEAPSEPAASRRPTARDRAMYVETVIQQAIRRGDFDDLPGSGKPIEGLGDHHDPDWWIRRKIRNEQLTGLGPPALMLRVEHAEFAERTDAFSREADVREYVEDFNRRVVEARRQLLGGPPVVTPTHDVGAEVAAWRERRTARAAAARDDPIEEPRPRRGLFRRR
ncbi:DUF1992 domain-containing protein [Microbacterium sp. SORGH_AS_0888]|uniref:DnaJ family domain-containing protein n=1 Tax=Microbacterium sp. SORGH_AS_0888 TaxID=3041791 RepID=UPI00277E13DA|nr:DUF1992 domain-containing protein [Microbacterium sp. SORGH_AS_0888]MDQ1131233.1 hypothetical protein [Microbacterium sp. SORGH_AS_0888]